MVYHIWFIASLLFGLLHESKAAPSLLSSSPYDVPIEWAAVMSESLLDVNEWAISLTLQKSTNHTNFAIFLIESESA